MPYAVVPETRAISVFPDPRQRIGKKEQRLWGATLSQVPYAYEDPYLRSAQDIQYMVDTSHMHRYPYLRPWESAPRSPMLFDQPFPGSANYIPETTSEEYLDTFGADEEFGKIDLSGLKKLKPSGKLLKKLKDRPNKGKLLQRWKNRKNKGKLKERLSQLRDKSSDSKGLSAGVSADSQPEYVDVSGSGGYRYRLNKDNTIVILSSPSGGVGKVVKPGTSAHKAISKEVGSYSSNTIKQAQEKPNLLSSVISSAQEIDNMPEPSTYSNLFSQAAENDKVSVMARLEQSGGQMPIMINDGMAMAEQELNARASEMEAGNAALKKSQEKNSVLLYTSIGAGVLALAAVGTLIMKK